MSDNPMKIDPPVVPAKVEKPKTPAAKFDRPRTTPVKVSTGSLYVPPWLRFAFPLIGLKEGAGAANNPEVVRFYADAGFPGVKHDDVAWCAAFVGAMLVRADLKPSGSLSARSYETWGRRLDKPGYGCVGVKKRGGNAPEWQGHVGFVVAANADHIWLLGGNQGDAVSVARFNRGDFTAFVWPDKNVFEPSTPPTSFTGALANVRES